MSLLLNLVLVIAFIFKPIVANNESNDAAAMKFGESNNAIIIGNQESQERELRKRKLILDSLISIGSSIVGALAGNMCANDFYATVFGGCRAGYVKSTLILCVDQNAQCPVGKKPCLNGAACVDADASCGISLASTLLSKADFIKNQVFPAIIKIKDVLFAGGFDIKKRNSAIRFLDAAKIAAKVLNDAKKSVCEKACNPKKKRALCKLIIVIKSKLTILRSIMSLAITVIYDLPKHIKFLVTTNPLDILNTESENFKNLMALKDLLFKIAGLPSLLKDFAKFTDVVYASTANTAVGIESYNENIDAHSDIEHNEYFEKPTMSSANTNYRRLIFGGETYCFVNFYPLFRSDECAKGYTKDSILGGRVKFCSANQKPCSSQCEKVGCKTGWLKGCDINQIKNKVKTVISDTMPTIEKIKPIVEIIKKRDFTLFNFAAKVVKPFFTVANSILQAFERGRSEICQLICKGTDSVICRLMKVIIDKLNIVKSFIMTGVSIFRAIKTTIMKFLTETSLEDIFTGKVNFGSIKKLWKDLRYAGSIRRRLSKVEKK